MAQFEFITPMGQSYNNDYNTYGEKYGVLTFSEGHQGVSRNSGAYIKFQCLKYAMDIAIEEGTMRGGINEKGMVNGETYYLYWLCGRKPYTLSEINTVMKFVGAEAVMNSLGRNGSSEFIYARNTFDALFPNSSNKDVMLFYPHMGLIEFAASLGWEGDIIEDIAFQEIGEEYFNVITVKGGSISKKSIYK